MANTQSQESIDSTKNSEISSEDVAQNAGARAAATNANPLNSLEEARKANAGESTNAAGSVAPSTAEEHIPSTSDPNATDLPTAR